jgi:hyperosmotically inducible protein
LLSAFVAATLAAAGAQAAETAGAAIDDSLITAKVKASLVKDPIAKAHEINVETHQGIVQLNGFVDSRDARAAAVADAKRIEGVTSVDDNLKIRAADRSAGTVIDDSAITAKVKTALIEDKRTKAHEIEVKTNDGVVSLGGFVDTASEKAAAGDVAMGVKGVTKVDNGLSVK